MFIKYIYRLAKIKEDAEKKMINKNKIIFSFFQQLSI